uniref:Small ribosomal subunit protein uS7 domain-containing protein n=1 Tax=Chenopodium quinoa TaxID=63459 RepID=A0A803MBG4_CHEQI
MLEGAKSTGAGAASNCSEILSYMGGLDSEQKQLIKKLVNFHMKVGKRTKVRAIVYKTFHRPARTEGDVIKLMVDSVDNIKPICKVEKVRVEGTIYDVLGIVARDRQQTIAIRWILEAAFKRRISYRISLEKCSFDEILDAYRKRGISRKKRENLHGLASANRSFAHFRWWPTYQVYERLTSKAYLLNKAAFATVRVDFLVVPSNRTGSKAIISSIQRLNSGLNSPFSKNPVIDSAAIESKPIESATAGTVSGVQIAVVGIFSAASCSAY